MTPRRKRMLSVSSPLPSVLPIILTLVIPPKRCVLALCFLSSSRTGAVASFLTPPPCISSSLICIRRGTQIPHRTLALGFAPAALFVPGMRARILPHHRGWKLDSLPRAARLPAVASPALVTSGSRYAYIANAYSVTTPTNVHRPVRTKPFRGRP
ncbi:hypothetical protein B0H13DRAFT_2577060 [Mycena leptocephala]|nr:hypothetical protein B0H13DRAFT_2577060 [Mycena leptocephala]